MKSTPQTAILLFTRTPLEEAVCKQFLPSKSIPQNAAIAKRFIDEAIAVAHQTGLPLIIKYSGSQHGNSFGERFANAIEDVFEEGFENVISIGTDSPSLSAQHLLEINNRLQDQPLAFGTSKDGGVYAIGIQKKAFNRAHFLAIPWRSSRVAKALQTLIAEGYIFQHCLPLLQDIDSHSDLLSWMQQADVQHAVFYFLKRIITGVQAKHRDVFALLSTPFSASHLLRGPPSFS